MKSTLAAFFSIMLTVLMLTSALLSYTTETGATNTTGEFTFEELAIPNENHFPEVTVTATFSNGTIMQNTVPVLLGLGGR